MTTITDRLDQAATGIELRSESGEVSRDELAELVGNRIAIVIPAYAEAENLEELLPRMPDQIEGVAAAVLVIDDGSRDGTADAAARGGAIVARLSQNRGGGAALRAGYALALGAGAKIVVTMDADGQHRPEDLPLIVEPVLSGRAELAQGSRVLGSAQSGALARELGIVFFNRLVRRLTGASVTDCSNSFRAMRTPMLAELDLRQSQFHAAELLIEAVTRGYSYEEVPVTVLRRSHGQSKKPPTLRYGRGFAGAILSAWRRSLRRRRAERR